ncbi:MAG: OmpH family outer membrane protein [Crocinitomicaceae bacterium]|jgi:outer membrane protein|nr:OmpH family outer membrane protein [Crocinitomicaceae bacterium]MDP4866646.1 OmpH family outer membrane protein [Crocinitomicaceae bacterium]MDP5011291.1 OmpH family outer membrane protein [Crocinitomicaceae bacterium]MDP5098927.1 OmpH family outer membrane protein [Crocinitomicaceae bacterium]
MKKMLFVLLVMFGTSFAFGQKYGYIDSDYIMANVPEYAEAKEKLDKLAERWTKEIEERYEVLKVKKDNFAREEVLLPEEEKLKRKEEIERLESEAMQMQKLRFGVSGDYFQKRQELIKPIQDKVFDAMQKVSSKRNYSFVFDKANQSNLVYADSKFDISDEVLKEMRITGK